MSRLTRVRRITNQSTGELGTILAETLAASGFEVLCLRGEAATRPEPTNAKSPPIFDECLVADAS